MPNQRIVVLVVEDEILIRMGIVVKLEDEGFEVVEASNAVEAIDLLVANALISVIFTDVDMPGGMDGLKLAAAVRERWRPVKIIVTSGHRKIDVDELPVEARFMMKPYNPDQVVRSIREMIA